MSFGLSFDGVARAFVHHQTLNASAVVATFAAREARQKHRLQAAAASLLGQAMTGAALMASLQKSPTSRVNLQLECDGALRGLFVDAAATGDVRGYVKNPYVDVELAEGEFRWRGALGNSGFLSVLRDMGEGEYYRSSVELTAMSLTDDLNQYFAKSDQVATRLVLDVVPQGDELLGAVAGVVLQVLPDGDVATLERLGATLQAKLRQVLTGPANITAEGVLRGLFADDGVEVLTTGPLQWKCTCSKEKVIQTLASLGPKEVQDILDTMGSTAVTCQFCGTKHEVSFQDLISLLESLGEKPRN